LGYIPKQPLIEEKKYDTSLTKAQNYHIMLKHLLKGIHEVQSDVSKRQNYPLKIGYHYKYVTLHTPIAFIIADTQGADKLCGRYLSYSTAVSRIHRTCKCTTELAADVTQQCAWVTMQEMMDVIHRNDKDLLMQYSQQYIPNHAFDGVDFGPNSGGIYGATPSDILHGIKLGIIHHILNLMHDLDMSPTSKHHFNVATTKLMPHFRQTCSSLYPRTYFPNGLSSLTSKTAEESVGVLFVTFIHLASKLGTEAFYLKKNFTVAREKQYFNVFDFILIFIQWLSSTELYWKIDDKATMHKACKIIQYFIKFLTSSFVRSSQQNWNVSKIHKLLHIPSLITFFGSPSNYDSAACKKMQKQIAKRPGRKAQKRHDTFDQQAASEKPKCQVAYFFSCAHAK
jgi:hypothetical protein